MEVCTKYYWLTQEMREGVGSSLLEDRVGLRGWAELEGSFLLKLFGDKIFYFIPDTFLEPRTVLVQRTDSFFSLKNTQEGTHSEFSKVMMGQEAGV